MFLEKYTILKKILVNFFFRVAVVLRLAKNSVCLQNNLSELNNEF